jgi:hypothetical protein
MEEVLGRNAPREVALVPLVAGLRPENCDWAERICIRLSSHSDLVVRGNAILGLGYLAMTCRDLTEDLARAAIQAGLQSDDEWIRGRSTDAAEMCLTYLGWEFPNPEN